VEGTVKDSFIRDSNITISIITFIIIIIIITKIIIIIIIIKIIIIITIVKCIIIKIMIINIISLCKMFFLYPSQHNYYHFINNKCSIILNLPWFANMKYSGSFLEPLVVFKDTVLVRTK
jgi:ABC-type uncharacterized transport system permease subunit